MTFCHKNQAALTHFSSLLKVLSLSSLQRVRTHPECQKIIFELSATGISTIEQIWDGCVPEEATVINDAGSISSGTVTYSGGSSSKTVGAVSVGKVVPTLEHGKDRVCSGGWLRRGEVLALVAHLHSKICQTCIWRLWRLNVGHRRLCRSMGCSCAKAKVFFDAWVSGVQSGFGLWMLGHGYLS